MPSDAAEATALSLPEWDGLESAVRRLFAHNDALRERVREAESRIRELEAALSDVAAGRVDPTALAERVDLLERENQQLNERLERARNSVQRILARMHFVEEEP
jgi:predicted RNase H-like nuclease (RuvC/YqgF family)